jgi:hypothetical protein
MVNLHIATETPDHPAPVIEKKWYRVVIFIAGFALGVAVMWATDFEPPTPVLVVTP